MSPVGLDELLAGLPQSNDNNLLVGFHTSDDAGVYRLSNETALLTTADLITPPVDDPFVFGQIGAANALSDIYAMGGRPLTCLNLICFPSKVLGPDVLHGIVEGALSKIHEAGAVLAGGHTVEDDEPKFGLAVTGIAAPDDIWRNAHAQPGDMVILTKPLGSGVLLNANLKGWVSDKAMKSCIDTMTTLNKMAANIAASVKVHAATDVTGFGLAGHAFEVARASGVGIEVRVAQLPVMDEALAMYERGMSTGVNQANRELVSAALLLHKRLPRWHEEILFDPQTNGGLLLTLPESDAETLMARYRENGIAARVIGAVKSRRDGILLEIV